MGSSGSSMQQGGMSGGGMERPMRSKKMMKSSRHSKMMHSRRHKKMMRSQSGM
jgi:hypothetical protein